jgi:hypothetical protein
MIAQSMILTVPAHPRAAVNHSDHVQLHVVTVYPPVYKTTTTAPVSMGMTVKVVVVVGIGGGKDR